MTVYATVDDLRALGVTLTAQQETAANVLLTQASAKLRLAARERGIDIDTRIADGQTGEDYALAVKSVVIQAVTRALGTVSSTAPAVASASQAGLGYSATVNYVNAGQSLYFLRAELADLCLLEQQFGTMEVYRDAASTGD